MELDTIVVLHFTVRPRFDISSRVVLEIGLRSFFRERKGIHKEGAVNKKGGKRAFLKETEKVMGALDDVYLLEQGLEPYRLPFPKRGEPEIVLEIYCAEG